MATSIIIGILSILVAALAGMNLYTLLDFNARIRRLKEEMMEETKKAVAKASSDAAGFALIHITEAMLHSYTVDYGEIIRLTLNAIGRPWGKRRKVEGDGIFKGLSSYWSRHTISTLAAEIDIPIDTISLMLGHPVGNPTTRIYIRQDMAKADKAVRKLLDYIK